MSHRSRAAGSFSDFLAFGRAARARSCAVAIVLATTAVTASACGPAPGYGPDGRMMTNPSGYQRNNGYRQAAPGQPTPGGYVGGPYAQQPQQQPPPPGYGPAPAPGQYGAYGQGGQYGQYGQGSQPGYPPGNGDPNGYGSPPSSAPPADSSTELAPPYPPPAAPPAAEPIAPDPASGACSNECRFANNGECDDGRSGSDTDVCASGTDCGDCGPAAAQ